MSENLFDPKCSKGLRRQTKQFIDLVPAEKLWELRERVLELLPPMKGGRSPVVIEVGKEGGESFRRQAQIAHLMELPHEGPAS